MSTKPWAADHPIRNVLEGLSWPAAVVAVLLAVRTVQRRALRECDKRGPAPAGGEASHGTGSPLRSVASITAAAADLRVPRQLPSLIRDFVGWDDELAALDSVLLPQGGGGPLAQDALGAAVLIRNALPATATVATRLREAASPTAAQTGRALPPRCRDSVGSLGWRFGLTRGARSCPCIWLRSGSHGVPISTTSLTSGSDPSGSRGRAGCLRSASSAG